MATADKMIDDMAARVETARKIPTKRRRKDAAKGVALPDGSFPIENATDLKNAVKALGLSKDKARAKVHILKRAKALGLVDELPTSWHVANREVGNIEVALTEKHENPKTALEEELEIVQRSPEYFELQFRDLERCRSILSDNLGPLQDNYYRFLSSQADAINAMAQCTVELVDAMPLSLGDVVSFIDGLEEACGKLGVPLSEQLLEYRRDIVGY